jgi:xanthine dehydrogenase accessory factor
MASDFYQQFRELLRHEQRLVLMIVIANEGSSPGRKGFKMAVSKSQMFGTIGGGIMEHKLVEYARSLLEKPTFSPFIKHQIHDKSAPTDQSGMICSGQQTIDFYDIDTRYAEILDSIVSEKKTTVHYSDTCIETHFNDTKTHEWHFSESTAPPNEVYVIGGGHVGLALCEVLSRLDFEIHILDHRENLNTMQANTFAHYRKVVAFEEIDRHIPEGDNIYVVIMSFGYRTDDIIIRRLLGKNFKYIGMMGSTGKIATLYQSLLDDGFDTNAIGKVEAPIGIDIKSETTHEIAISVAARLISVKNKNE